MATQRDLAVESLTVFVDQLGFGVVLPFLPLHADGLGASGYEAGGPGIGGLLYDHVSHGAPFQVARGLWTRLP